jgi:hypothetical protein
MDPVERRLLVVERERLVARSLLKSNEYLFVLYVDVLYVDG